MQRPQYGATVLALLLAATCSADARDKKVAPGEVTFRLPWGALAKRAAARQALVEKRMSAARQARSR